MTITTQLAFIEGVGGGELLLVMVIALMLFGSKNLPGLARTFGRTAENMRRTVREVKDEIMKAELDPPATPVLPPPRVLPAAHLADPPAEKKDPADEPPAG